MPTFNGLYYPFIHFRDEDWLKSAILFWDSIGRIVPAEYQLRDPDSIQLLRDKGIVQNFNPEPDAYHVADIFAETINRHAEELRPKYGISRQASWPNDEVTVRHSEGRNPRLSYLHDEKISDGLREALQDSGLATGHGEDDVWIGMHRDLLNVYMSALADATARSHGANPLPSTPREQVAAAGLTAERLASILLDRPGLATPIRSREEIEGLMASVAFQSISPIDLSEVPMELLIQIRTDWEDERHAFQLHLREMTAQFGELRDVQDSQELITYLTSEYQRRLAPSIALLETRLLDANVNVVKGLVNVQVALPPAVSATLDMVGSNPLAAGLATAAAIGYRIYRVWRRRSDDRHEVFQNTPESYLYHVRSELAPTGFAHSVAQVARRFM